MLTKLHVVCKVLLTLTSTAVVSNLQPESLLLWLTTMFVGICGRIVVLRAAVRRVCLRPQDYVCVHVGTY
jgi:hypothetical protein